MKEKQYSIGDVSKMTGISLKKIRYWQSRGYLKDERIVCGLRSYRFFSEEDIKLIKAVKILMERGYTLSHASRLARAK
jgi:DNA-binding transcriptional MerR regulator